MNIPAAQHKNQQQGQVPHKDPKVLCSVTLYRGGTRLDGFVRVDGTCLMHIGDTLQSFDTISQDRKSVV